MALCLCSNVISTILILFVGFVFILIFLHHIFCRYYNQTPNSIYIFEEQNAHSLQNTERGREMISILLSVLLVSKLKPSFFPFFSRSSVSRLFFFLLIVSEFLCLYPVIRKWCHHHRYELLTIAVVYFALFFLYFWTQDLLFIFMHVCADTQSYTILMLNHCCLLLNVHIGNEWESPCESICFVVLCSLIQWYYKAHLLVTLSIHIEFWISFFIELWFLGGFMALIFPCCVSFFLHR